MTSPPTETCAALVRHFEGLAVNAYSDPVGIWTIGYGHTGPDVHRGQEISEVEAETLLANDLADAAEDVDRLIRGLKTCERDALVSFVYNLGAGALSESRLLRMLKRGDVTSAAEQFDAWVHAHVAGKLVTLPGLVRRRAAERAMFEGRDWQETL